MALLLVIFELKAELNLLLTFCVLWYFYVCHTQQQNTAFENYFLKLMFGNISTITHFISDSQLVGRNPKVDHWLVLVGHGPLTGQKIVFREKKSVWPINTLLQYVAVSICIEHGEMQIRHRTQCFFLCSEMLVCEAVITETPFGKNHINLSKINR